MRMKTSTLVVFPEKSASYNPIAMLAMSLGVPCIVSSDSAVGQTLRSVGKSGFDRVVVGAEIYSQGVQPIIIQKLVNLKDSYAVAAEIRNCVCQQIRKIGLPQLKAEFAEGDWHDDKSTESTGRDSALTSPDSSLVKSNSVSSLSRHRPEGLSDVHMEVEAEPANSSFQETDVKDTQATPGGSMDGKATDNDSLPNTYMETPAVQACGEALTGADQPEYSLNMDKLKEKMNKLVEKHGNQIKRCVIAVADTGVNSILPAVPFKLPKGILHQKSFTDSGDDTMMGKPTHGTEVAFVILENNTNVTLYDLQVTSDPQRNYKACDLINALNYVRDIRHTSLKVDIINISLGQATAPADLRKIIADLTHDHIIVCAASNDGKRAHETILYPANMDGTIAVGSHDVDGNRLPDSPQGQTLDFLAPGKWKTLELGKGCKDVSGTSYAAPFVSAVAAHVLAAARCFDKDNENNGRDSKFETAVSSTAGMKFVLQKMCTRGLHAADEGAGLLKPWESFQKIDKRLLDYLEQARDKFAGEASG